jgi:hypothetical protein
MKQLLYMDNKDKIGGSVTDKDVIDKIIIDNGLSVSYSINYNGITINKKSNKIYPIHSISKLFTNIMLVLLYDDNICIIICLEYFLIIN